MDTLPHALALLAVAPLALACGPSGQSAADAELDALCETASDTSGMCRSEHGDLVPVMCCESQQVARVSCSPEDRFLGMQEAVLLDGFVTQSLDVDLQGLSRQPAPIQQQIVAAAEHALGLRREERPSAYFDAALIDSGSYTVETLSIEGRNSFEGTAVRTSVDGFGLGVVFARDSLLITAELQGEALMACKREAPSK